MLLVLFPVCADTLFVQKMPRMRRNSSENPARQAGFHSELQLSYYIRIICGPVLFAVKYTIRIRDPKETEFSFPGDPEGLLFLKP